MRKPSDKLVDLLTRLEVCSEDDLFACEPVVRQLAQDLPDFDTVWLDALVLNGVISSWQAEILQSPQPDRIRVGDYLLESALGEHTFLASRSPAVGRFVLRRMNDCSSVLPEPYEDRHRAAGDLSGNAASLQHAVQVNAAGRIREIIEQIRSADQRIPTAVVMPVDVVPGGSGQPGVMVSEFVEGWPADELIIRGGRLPPAAVAEIGRELLIALAWLESRRLLHGDMVLRNVRLTPAGTVRLVDPFVRSLTQPDVTVNDQLTLRQIEGIAPERIGAGRRGEIRGELYAVGCLLWQLLTSRPVVLNADPISRLLQLRQHDIPDPRVHVPDCPEWLARQIISLTRRTPELRPATAEAALHAWMEDGPTSLSACRSLARNMPDRTHQTRPRRKPIRGRNRRSRRNARIALSAMLLVAAGALAGARFGILPQKLQFSLFPGSDRRIEVAPTAGMTASPDVAGDDQGLRILPSPADPGGGVIELSGDRPFVAMNLSVTGDVEIRGTGSAPAVLLISEDTGWHIAARRIRLRHVQLRVMPPGEGSGTTTTRSVSTAPLLNITADRLEADSCIFHVDDGATPRTGVLWKSDTESESAVSISNSVFTGSGQGLWLTAPPQQLTMDNVLLATRSTPLRIDCDPADRPLIAADFNRVTQRFGESLMDLAVRSDTGKPIRLQVTCGECVFAPQSALIRFAAPATWEPRNLTAEFVLPDTGNPAIVSPDVARMIYIDRSLGQLVEAAPENFVADGLLYSVPTFRGPNGSPTAGKWKDSELLDFDGPKLSRIMPGIVAEELPDGSTDFGSE